MTQNVSGLMIDSVDLALTQQGKGFGCTTAIVQVSTNNYLIGVLKNLFATGGPDIAIVRRDIQQASSGIIQATNFRNPSILTGSDVTTASVGNRALSKGDSRITTANISFTSAMRSTTIPDGTAGVPKMISGPLSNPTNTDAIILHPGDSFGIAMGGPAANGLGGATTANMEITFTCLLLG